MNQLENGVETEQEKERSKTIDRGISMAASTVTARTKKSQEVLSLFSG
jgi:hypothetical protein